MSRNRTTQRGFTLIEIMIVVAMIAVLVAIAIPVFSGTSRKAKGGSEVGSYFQDFRTRMDQYLQEHGVYPPTIGEGTFWPAAPTAAKQTILPLPLAWTTDVPVGLGPFKFRMSGSADVYCGYTWATGTASDNTNRGGIAAAAPFNFTAPETSWYYLMAKCNLDGVGGFSYYFTSSVNPAIQVLNEGS